MNHALADCEVDGMGHGIIDMVLMGRAGSSQAHDGGADEGEPNEATDPVHGDRVGLPLLKLMREARRLYMMVIDVTLSYHSNRSIN